MAFTWVMLKKYTVATGEVVEEGTWDGAAVTTGNIVADTTTQPEMSRIVDFALSSNGDTAVLPAQDVAPATLKITFTSGDAGKYMIKGPAV